MKRPKSEYAIQAVTNALRLLEAFEEGEEFGVTELARRLGLHKNNVFRLLATLEQKGYVAKSPSSDRYRLGTSCLGIGQSFARGHELVRRSRHAVETLAQETGESAHLAVLGDFEVVHLDGAECGEQLVRTALRVGGRLPAHCTALGKVLLGCSPDSVLDAFHRHVMTHDGLAARTPATITDRDKLFEHLRAVGARGWAVDEEECEVGLVCAAAPVVGPNGQVVAALSVSAPAFRLDAETLEVRTAALVVAAAANLSRALGHL